jgi:hypothetical protein
MGGMPLMMRKPLPARYCGLLNYLTGGQWQDADRETDRLMLDIAGRKEKGFLYPEDLEAFPCEDLWIIDQLWVECSDGLFGFSVQKQIYVETGNPLDGKWHQETFAKFCDRTVWRKNDAYISNPDDITFDFSAPKGHLPFLRCFLLLDCTCVLFSRMEAYELLEKSVLNCFEMGLKEKS